VNHRRVPKYAEFTISAAYVQAKDDATVMGYLPDLGISKKLPNRAFVFGVLNTLRPDFMEQVIQNAI